MIMPKVSICIPIYKTALFIEQCAVSLFAQSYQNIEYIFVDDASPDDCVHLLQKVIDAYPQRRPQVKIIRHEKNLGLVAARKTALSVATGDYIIHCDSDDWVDCNYIKELYLGIEKSQADMAYCDMYRVGPKGDVSLISAQECETGQDFISGIFERKIHASLCNKLYKKEIAKNLYLDVPNSITMCEDERRNIQMLILTSKTIKVNKGLYYYRYNPTSITSHGYTHELAMCRIQNINFYEQILKGNCKNIKSLQSLKQLLIIEFLQTCCLSAKEWRPLWKNAQRQILSSDFCWKIKAIWVIARINYYFASWLYRKIQKR